MNRLFAAFRLLSILGLSAAATIFFWTNAAHQVPGGSAMFFRWASDLFGIMPPDLAQRDIGFPLLIWFSGGSVAGAAALYSGFGLLMPLLIYHSLRPFGPWIAWLAALAAIVSCGPWLFAGFMYPDQACIFFMTLSLAVLTRYLVGNKPAQLWAFTAATLFLSVTRPAMNAVFPCLMLVAILFGPNPKANKSRQQSPKPRQHIVHWFSILGCIGAFGACLAVYHAYRAYAFNVAQLGYTPSYTGEQIFYNAYVNLEDFGVVLDYTPAVKEIDDGLRRAIQPTPQQAQIVQEVAAQNTPEFNQANLFLPTADALVSRIWNEPNFEYAMLIDGAVSDAVLLQAAKEIAEAHPRYFAAFVMRNLYHFLIAPGFAHTRGNTAGFVATHLDFYPESADTTEAALLGALTPPASPQMVQLAEFWRSTIYWPFIWITSGLWLAACIAVFTAPVLYSRAFLGSFIAASGLFAYNVLIVSAFAEPDFRYEAMTLVLRATLAGFALVALCPKWRLPRG